jgi:hypothetical protein
VCDYCQCKTVDADGNQVKFFNTHDGIVIQVMQVMKVLDVKQSEVKYSR